MSFLRYVISIVNIVLDLFVKRKERPKKYHSSTLLDFLKDLWVVTNLACSKRLKPAIPLWLPYYHLHKNNCFTPKDLKLIEEISP